jgi:folate-dependent phosphoribosylglycinamide formyltransferase PurN
MLRVAWFATGRGETSPKLLRATLDAIDSGLEAEVAVVFSNQEPGDSENGDRFFDLVKSAGIPLVTLSDVKFRRGVGGAVARKGQPLPAWRRDYDEAVAGLLEPYDFDLGVMAGYLLILTQALHDRWPILNLHPALPDGPIGLWQDVIWQLIAEDAGESGVLTFLSTADLDRGPPTTYCRYSLRGADIEPLWEGRAGQPVEALQAAGETDPLFQAIRARGVLRELPLVVETLKAFATGRIRTVPAEGTPPFAVVDSTGKAVDAFDLTPEVEAAVARSEVSP